MRKFPLAPPFLALLAYLAAPGCVSPPALSGPARAAPRRDFGEGSLVAAHNQERAAAGLPPLRADPALTAAARAHADDMARHRRMSHTGSDLSSPFRRITRAGYVFTAAAENVAYGQAGVTEVMRDWMSSRGHRRNILGDFDAIGTASATDATGRVAWCVTFGKPARTESP